MSRPLLTLMSGLLAAQISFAPPALAEPSVTGEVMKVDEAAGEITLEHGPIAKLDMPPMTMVFKVARPDMLKTLKPGDKVKFEADSIKGVFTVTEMQKAK